MSSRICVMVAQMPPCVRVITQMRRRIARCRLDRYYHGHRSTQGQVSDAFRAPFKCSLLAIDYANGSATRPACIDLITCAVHPSVYSLPLVHCAATQDTPAAHRTAAVRVLLPCVRGFILHHGEATPPLPALASNVLTSACDVSSL